MSVCFYFLFVYFLLYSFMSSIFSLSFTRDSFIFIRRYNYPRYAFGSYQSFISILNVNVVGDKYFASLGDNNKFKTGSFNWNSCTVEAFSKPRPCDLHKRFTFSASRPLNSRCDMLLNTKLKTYSTFFNSCVYYTLYKILCT